MFSVPTVYVEPKGLFLLEAMACGVPVVQPRHGAFPEMLAKTSGGILVEPGDTQSLAEGLYKLWKNPALRAELGQNGFDGVREHYSIAGRPTACSRCTRRKPRGHGALNVSASGSASRIRRRRATCRCCPMCRCRLRPGDAAAIMGPSGSGKSTLLYILGALEPPTTGTVTLDGKNPFALVGRRSRRVSQQGNRLRVSGPLPAAAVQRARERARAHARRAGRMPAATRMRVTLVDQVGLSHRVTHLPGQLSGGEKQRVALARALVRRPRLLLCDEPTGNLDRASAEAVASLLFELQQKQKAILIVVTHSAELAARFPIRFDLVDRRLQRVA